MQLYADPHHQQSPDDFIRLSNYSGGRGWGYCGKCTVNNCLININNSLDGHGSTTNPQNARQHCGWGGGGTSPAVIEVEADWLHSLYAEEAVVPACLWPGKGVVPSWNVVIVDKEQKQPGSEGNTTRYNLQLKLTCIRSLYCLYINLPWAHQSQQLLYNILGGVRVREILKWKNNCHQI